MEDRIAERAKEMQREYQREWRKRNREKVKKYNATYWERKAAKAAAENDSQGE